MSSRPGAYQESEGFRLVGHTTVGARGDGMHVAIKDDVAYFGHQGNSGTSIIDIADPSNPRPIGRLPAPPNTHSHKVQIVGDTMLINREREPEKSGGTFDEPWTAGISVFDVSDARHPREIGFWSCGGRGVHRMTYWSEPYAYVTAGSTDITDQFLVILDLTNPARPVEVGRWWFPGMHHKEEDVRDWEPARTVKLHHALPGEDGLLFCGWWDKGLVVLDTTELAAPKLVSHLDLDRVDGPSRNTHTAAPIPGRNALVVTDECITGDICNIHRENEVSFQARVVDVTEPENPTILSRFPEVPAAYCHCARGGRLGPHNVHEMKPGSFQSDQIIFMTHFNGGLRAYDLSELSTPVEIGHFVPEAPPGRSSSQMNDVYIRNDGLIFTTERYGGGLYILEFESMA